MELIFALVVLGVLGFLIARIYNKLVSYQTQYVNGYSQIDVQLKRRLDLIPNMVDVAKKYMAHESEVLIKVTQARSDMTVASENMLANPSKEAMKTMAVSELALGNAMSGFNIRAEAYPELKANENMIQLSEELVTTENRIAYARQSYNDLVQKFNEFKKQFPNILFAGMLGFKEDAILLEFEDKAEMNKPPVMSF